MPAVPNEIDQEAINQDLDALSSPLSGGATTGPAVTAGGNATGTVAIAAPSGIVTYTFTGNVTFTAPTGAVVGDLLLLKITQDATGSRTVTWPATFKTNVAISTTAAYVDQIMFVFDGTNYNQVSSVLHIA